MASARVAKLRFLRRDSGSTTSDSDIKLQRGQPLLDMTTDPGTLYVGQGEGSLDESGVNVKHSDKSDEAGKFDHKINTFVNLESQSNVFWDGSETIIVPGVGGHLAVTNGGTGSIDFNVNNVGAGVLATAYGGTGRDDGTIAQADSATNAQRAETQNSDDNSTRIATTAFVQTKYKEIQDEIDDILNFGEDTFTVAGVPFSIKRLAGVAKLDFPTEFYDSWLPNDMAGTNIEVGQLPTGYYPESDEDISCLLSFQYTQQNGNTASFNNRSVTLTLKTDGSVLLSGNTAVTDPTSNPIISCESRFSHATTYLYLIAE